MRNSLLFFLIVFCSVSSVFGEETRTAEDIIQQKHVTLPYYFLKTGLNKAMVIDMPFGKATVSETDRKVIRASRILKIELVYTDYPIGSDLNALNLKRINALKAIRSDLVTNKEVVWRIVKQTSCRNEAEAKVLFHGIVIHYIPPQSKEVMEADISWMDRFLPPRDSIESIEKAVAKLPDTTVFSVLNRNDDWKEMHVISDLTGSMTPYVSQLVLWFELNRSRQRLSYVTFFNDGDNKTTAQKVIGATKGIYHGKAEKFNQIRALMNKTMRKGSGGDGPENDIEAILAAIEAYPDAKEYVLIADNMAPVKDVSLLSKVDKPIRIVLCGTKYGVNEQYLNIALATGGSVHTMEKDLDNLSKFKEGEILIFGRKAFKVQDGKFVPYQLKMKKKST